MVRKSYYASEIVIGLLPTADRVRTIHILYCAATVEVCVRPPSRFFFLGFLAVYLQLEAAVAVVLLASGGFFVIWTLFS